MASPHPEHAANAELALQHGKHVLVEKPFALTGVEARRIRDVARSTGLFAMEAMRTRFMPHTVRIHELIAEGALGDIRALIADHHQKLNPDPVGRLWNPALGGGALLDLGIYPVSFASDFLGTPEEIMAASIMTPTTGAGVGAGAGAGPWAAGEGEVASATGGGAGAAPPRPAAGSPR